MRLEETTLRDFGGGWNVSDSDKSLGPRFQPVSENIVRGTDGHFAVRHGYKLLADLRDGVEDDAVTDTPIVSTTNGSSVVSFEQLSHGYTAADKHITISDFTGDINGISADVINGTHSLLVDDVDNFSIYVRGVATGTGTDPRTFTWVVDNHSIGGNDIFGRYFRNYLIVFTDIGEVIAVDFDGQAEIIWSYAHADALTLEPWTDCDRVSAEIIRGRLIAANGATNDKPIAIEADLEVNYLVDASTLSNSAIPRADFVIAASQYVILVNTEYGPTMLEIGAKNTVMTCSREVDPSDAIELDLGMLTQTVDATILGASVIRSRVFIAFADRTMLGTLGIYVDVGGDSIHEPDFNDNIAEFGSFSHASIVSLGNDIFSAGMNGINSLEVSRASGEFEPSTISDLIHPVLLRHFTRLTEEDRRYKTFAVFDNNSRAYMLFAPKYSAGTLSLGDNPFVATTTLQPYNLLYMECAEHTFDEGDYLDITGATGIAGVPAAGVNGRRRIRHVIDKQTIVIEVDAYSEDINSSLGGDQVSVEPVNDETVAYVYEYNPKLKIRRWTRFRDLQFSWGARSQLNKLFFGYQGKIWQMGDQSNPISADKVGEFDDRAWANSHSYTSGTRVLDDANGRVYECQVDHMSALAGSFYEDRITHDTYWTEWTGYPISWAMDTSWTDFKDRSANKEIATARFDTIGSAAFSVSAFANSHYKNFESYALDPVITTEFVGQGSPGFGGGDQPFGGGRNTAQEWLHGFPVSGKLLRFRFFGSSVHPLKVTAATFYYAKSRALT